MTYGQGNLKLFRHKISDLQPTVSPFQRVRASVSGRVATKPYRQSGLASFQCASRLVGAGCGFRDRGDLFRPRHFPSLGAAGAALPNCLLTRRTPTSRCHIHFLHMSTTETTQQSLTPEAFPFTDPQLMIRYVTDTGKILPRKYTGLSAKQQRAVTKTRKRSRNMLLAQ